jgi:hypothetical protein
MLTTYTRNIDCPSSKISSKIQNLIFSLKCVLLKSGCLMCNEPVECHHSTPDVTTFCCSSFHRRTNGRMQHFVSHIRCISTVTVTNDGGWVLDVSAHLLSRAPVSQSASELVYSVTSSVKQAPFVSLSLSLSLSFYATRLRSCLSLYSEMFILQHLFSFDCNDNPVTWNNNAKKESNAFYVSFLITS